MLAKRNDSLWKLETITAVLAKYTEDLQKQMDVRNTMCKDIEELQSSLYLAKETIKMPKFSPKYEQIQGYTMKNV